MDPLVVESSDRDDEAEAGATSATSATSATAAAEPARKGRGKKGRRRTRLGSNREAADPLVYSPDTVFSQYGGWLAPDDALPAAESALAAERAIAGHRTTTAATRGGFAALGNPSTSGEPPEGPYAASDLSVNSLALRWDFHQQRKTLTIEFLSAGIAPRDVQASFSEFGCSVRTPQWSWESTFKHPTVPQRCKVKVTKKKVELHIYKADTIHWADLGDTHCEDHGVGGWGGFVSYSSPVVVMGDGTVESGRLPGAASYTKAVEAEEKDGKDEDLVEVAEVEVAEVEVEAPASAQGKGDTPPGMSPGSAEAEPESKPGGMRDLDFVHHDWSEDSLFVHLKIFVACTSFYVDATRQALTLYLRSKEAKLGGTGEILYRWALELAGTIDTKNISVTKEKKRVTLRLNKDPPRTWRTLIRPEHSDSTTAPAAGPTAAPVKQKTPARPTDPDPDSGSGPSAASAPAPSLLTGGLFAPGTAGLENIGNTCFMNSVLQVLGQLPALRALFMSGAFEQDINVSNVLGSGGKVARCYAALMAEMWSGKSQSIRPAKLKTLLGQRKAEFRGFGQQDAHELLEHLLDNLHEDLNRVIDKPYIATPDYNGEPDVEVAAEAWVNHLARNDSAICDLMHGQYRSRLVCPECKFESIRFDPFSSVTLPLPQKKRRQQVTVVPLGEGELQCYSLVVPVKGEISALISQLSRIRKCPVRRFRVCEAYNGKFQRVFQWKDRLETIGAQDVILCFELEEELRDDQALMMGLNRFLVTDPATVCGACGAVASPDKDKFKRCTRCRKISYCSVDCQKAHWTKHRTTCKSSQPECFGVPYAFITPNEVSYATVKKAALRAAKRFLDFSAPVTTAVKTCNKFGHTARRQVLDPKKPDAVVKAADVDFVSLDFSAAPGVISQKELEVSEPADPTADEDQAEPDLSKALELFSREETLDPADSWFCPKCKKHQEATKQIHIWKAPECLFFHLKRFSFRNVLWRDKLEDLIRFPLDGLDMSPYICDPSAGAQVYDLCGVINHFGKIWGGHYTAHARHADDGQWRTYDDRAVSGVSSPATRVCSKSAYILVYRRRPASAPAPIPIPAAGGAKAY